MATLAERDMCGLPLILPVTEKNTQSTRRLLQAQQRSPYVHTAFQLTRKAPHGGCPVNPVQDKRTGIPEVSTILTIFEHTPLGLYSSVQSMPLVENKPWRKSNLHFSPSFPCFISFLSYKQLTS